ncbi:antitoxin Xre/MbcA/ParS toxin-binding domain-containing protein [Bradyrhizobium sp. STM 3557]|uniref:antitoxin Xre/MbcA/ParS toxin-binding domain-containing protein n=1 Tax=Bradyrhizobium sp. STM 3557 TaxID=578920 RepID=UPI00388DBA1C
MNSDFALSLPLDPPNLVCLALGIVIIAFLSMKKFDEPTFGVDADLTTQLLPRYLATRKQYSRALIGYIASLVGILGLLSLIGPRLLDLSPALAPYKPVAPIGFALLLVGALANIPWLQDIEWRIRHFWHERAYIPAAARAIADTLRASNFEFSAYTQPAMLASASMRGIEPTDFQAPRGSIEHGWARLTCLSYELGRRRNAGDIEALDADILDRYATDLDNIAAKRQAMEADMAQYRQEKARNPYYDNNELNKAITGLLRNLYILLGCAVRLKASPTTDINIVFRSFGFALGPSAASPDPNQDLIIVGLAVMTASLFILTFVAVAVGYIGIWRPSDNFPKDAVQPFIWSLSALLVHGCAILTADWTRARFLRNGRWFLVVGQARRPIAANYIRVAFCCALTGYVALYLWGVILQPSTIDLAKDTAPFALLPAATGAFYGYHLDNVELGRRPWRPWEIGAQALVTALCGLVATLAWLALGGAVAGNADFVALATLFTAVVGASLAWYLPQAAASRRCDPMAEARNARIAMLGAAALERFGNADLADQWLARPHPALDNRTPRDAAADIELFPKVLGLLHRPLEVVAA